MQLSVLSIGLYLPLWIGDPDPFRGLSVWAWGVAILSECLVPTLEFYTFVTSDAITVALGGLLVALSVKYANSILKTVAVSGAIVVNCVFGWLALDGPMGVSVVVGQFPISTRLLG